MTWVRNDKNTKEDLKKWGFYPTEESHGDYWNRGNYSRFEAIRYAHHRAWRDQIDVSVYKRKNLEKYFTRPSTVKVSQTPLCTVKYSEVEDKWTGKWEDERVENAAIYKYIQEKFGK